MQATHPQKMEHLTQTVMEDARLASKTDTVKGQHVTYSLASAKNPR
jgi:hypothetical protein